MSNYNPDAPTDNTAGFLQHTYQAPTNDTFFWNGSGINGFGNGIGYNDGSRRNAMNPVNPGCCAPNPFTQFGQQQPQSIPESAVQPFSSYPPSTPCAIPAQQNSFSLNSMVESRRNAPPTQVGQNNPWAPQQQAPQYPVAPQQPQFPQPSLGSYFDPNMTPGFRVDISSSALYGQSSFNFDKHNSWDNYYTQNRTIGMPNINWQPSNYSVPQGYAAYSQPTAQYPVNQFQTTQPSWRDIAEKNWSNV